MKLCFLLYIYVVLVEGNDVQKTLHDGNNQLTARIFSEIVKDKPDNSVVLSAYSLITPLSQLAAASQGESHDQLLNAIGIPDDTNTTNGVFVLMDEKFNSIKGVELKKASRLYIPLGYHIQDEFAAISKSVYHNDIVNINFLDNKKSAKEINTWVEDQTNQRIKDLVDPGFIDEFTRGVLVNALYFKGTWKHPFDKFTTRDRNFYVNDQKNLRIPMMHNTEKYRYIESAKLKSQILELPYEGDQSSFVVVLPTDKDGIGQLIEKLKDPNVLDEETRNMFNVEVRVNIPKFKIETSTNLKKILMKINVTHIFNKSANLTKLLKTDETLFVSHAVQKAFIEVNEEGAEAAAANAFIIAVGTSLIPSINFDFTADHPFAFFLKVQDEILFNGVFYGS